MLRFSPPLTLKLGHGELLAWNQGDVSLRVIAGAAWITQQDDLVDHFLAAGQCFELRRGTRVLIGAEQDVWLRLEYTAGWGHWLRDVFRWGRRRLTGRATPAATVAG
jgi:hypothetical protein